MYNFETANIGCLFDNLEGDRNSSVSILSEDPKIMLLHYTFKKAGFFVPLLI